MVKIFNRYMPLRVFIFAGIDTLCILIITTICLLVATDWKTVHSNQGLLLIISTGIACIVSLYLFDLYDLELTCRSNDVIVACMRAIGVGAISIAPFPLIFGHLGTKIHYLETGLAIMLALICSYRIVYEFFATRLNQGERILLIGHGRVIDLLARHVYDQSCLPIQLVAIMSSSKPIDVYGNSKDRDSELDSLITSFQPDRIAIDRSLEPDVVSAVHLMQLRQRGIRVEDAASLYEAITARVPVEMLQASNLAFGPGFCFTPWSALVHRVVDSIVASILIILGWPLLLILALWVKIDSVGPVLYKQERVGLHNKLFQVIKFRSMRSDAEISTGPIWAQQKDQRITRCGRILRKLRFDELPQIWNVLRGDMSLVGPRPERPHFVEMLRVEIPFYDLRHSVRPGITGWAQVSAPYGASIEESLAKLEYDLFYLKNKSILFDAFIFFRTAKVCLLGRGSR